MTDKELLELAAKAVGFYFNPVLTDDHGLYGCFNDDKHQSTYPWNPLTDDGDALRLVVKLKMLVDTHVPGSRGYSCDAGNGEVKFQTEHLGKDPYAATRRVIVRAAAEIGKGMQHA